MIRNGLRRLFVVFFLLAGVAGVVFAGPPGGHGGGGHGGGHAGGGFGGGHVGGGGFGGGHVVSPSFGGGHAVSPSFGGRHTVTPAYGGGHTVAPVVRSSPPAVHATPAAVHPAVTPGVVQHPSTAVVRYATTPAVTPVVVQSGRISPGVVVGQPSTAVLRSAVVPASTTGGRGTVSPVWSRTYTPAHSAAVVSPSHVRVTTGSMWGGWGGGYYRPVGWYPYSSGLYYRRPYTWNGWAFGYWPGGFTFGLGYGYPWGFGLGLSFGSPWGYRYGGYGYGSPYLYRGWSLGGGYQTYGYPLTTLSAPLPVTPSFGVLPNGTQLVPAPVPADSASGGSFADQADRLFHDGKYDDAAKAYQHAAVDDPKNAAIPLRAALAMTAAGRYDEAAGAAQQGLAMLPPEQWLSATKGSAGGFDSAKTADAVWDSLKKAADDPKAELGVKFLAGVMATGRGDYTRAAADLKAVVQTAPQDPVAKQLKSLVEEKLKDK